MPSPSRLSRFFEDHKERILAEWEAIVRRTPAAVELPRPELLDSMPALIDRITRMAESLSAGLLPDLSVPETESHARQRAAHGYELSELVGEYAALREAIFVVLEHDGPDLPGPEYRLLDRALDLALQRTAQHFLKIKERRVQALEALSLESLGRHDMETLFRRLLRALKGTSPAVDEVTILLREGDTLRVAASVGLTEERDAGFTLQVGEGFAGTIARTRRPLLLRDAERDPLVRSDFLHQRRIKALYGVPLLLEDELVGVAHMGSLRAHDFSENDKLLFRALADRAAALLLQAQLLAREQAARREAEAEREQLERERALREQFVSLLTHDLRTPLSAALLSAQMLARRAEDAERVRATADRIAQTLGRAERMIRDLLDTNLIRAGGRLPIHPERLELGALAAEVVDELSRQHGDRFVVNRSGELVGRWDRDLLRRAIENLCTNAVKYGAPDLPITVTVEPRGEQADVGVHNHGGTLTPEEQVRLFEPFQRAASARGSGKKGWGLGLTLVRGAAEAHGGRVEVHSSPEAGTRFDLLLPLEPPAGPPSVG